ncbi:MAG TPA: thiosulfate oxidation carrier protein SoxY [Pseudothauera hydrothermalis]|nr:thiosulfate oxidation carrier protein SoxY [Pseudothauera hydrothermalis]
MDNRRRNALKAGGALGVLGVLAAAGLITPAMAQTAWNKAAFDAKSIEAALRAIGAGQPADSADILISAPETAENGAAVSVGVLSHLPNTEYMAIMVENNPAMLAASFQIPAGTLADVQTRIKMGQTSNVFAVVKADGRFYMTKKEVKVTLGGCGG